MSYPLSSIRAALGLSSDAGEQECVDKVNKWRERLEQTEVQLAGCMTAASGWSQTKPAVKGDYGWSPAYEEVLQLRRHFDECRSIGVRVTEERDRYREALRTIEYEIRLADSYGQPLDTIKLWRIAETALTTPEPPASPQAGSLLRPVNEPLPAGCYCQPGRCMAPVIMGRQMPCRDPEKAAAKSDNVTSIPIEPPASPSSEGAETR